MMHDDARMGRNIISDIICSVRSPNFWIAQALFSEKGVVNRRYLCCVARKICHGKNTVFPRLYRCFVKSPAISIGESFYNHSMIVAALLCVRYWFTIEFDDVSMVQRQACRMVHSQDSQIRLKFPKCINKRSMTSRRVYRQQNRAGSETRSSLFTYSWNRE